MSEFDAVFSELVLWPWQKACLDADHPWQGTPDLKSKWRACINDEDPCVSLCGALGLSRCSSLDSPDELLINEYFRAPKDEVVPTAVLLMLLLTGGTPPVVIWEAFLASLFKPDIFTEPPYWHYLSALLRHPRMKTLAEASLKNVSTIPFQNFICHLNPMIEPSFDPSFFSGHRAWFEAVRVFHPMRKRMPLERIPDGDLARFAYFLRTDFDQDEFRGATRSILLEEPFFFAQLHHPCAHQGRAPSFDPLNPSKEALEYFSTETPVCSLWRFYNPLLTSPWMMEDVASTRKEGLYMGLLLLGFPSMESAGHSVFDRASLRPLIETHPSWVLGSTYLHSKGVHDAQTPHSPSSARDNLETAAGP
jgi:hypothetical protein